MNPVARQSGVSVVVPCRNGAAYLEEALEAVLSQDRTPDEVIVVDDGSTDESAAIARSLGVTVLAQPECLGLPAARNLGASQARHEFIALCDADDIWLSHHLATVLPLLEGTPQAALSFGRVQLFGDLEWTQEQVLPAGRPESVYWKQYHRNLVIPSSSVIRASAWEQVGGFDERLTTGCEDWEFFLRLAERFPFIAAGQVTVHYRKHAASMTSTRTVGLRRVEYEIRARLLEEVRRSEEPGTVARHEEALRKAWRSRLEDAWHARESAELSYILELSRFVPGSGPLQRQWVLRRTLVPLAIAYDRLRSLRA